MTGPDDHPPDPGPAAGVDDIQADIERTREQLGETVGALSAKLDVKGRAQQKIADTRERVIDKSREVRSQAQAAPVPVAAVAAVAAALLLGIIIWRRRH